MTFMAAPGFTSPPGGCQFEGSFFGFDYAGKVNWISNSQGHSRTEGTVVLEVLMDPVTLNSLIPNAVDYTEFRGVWRRIDGNMFQWVGISLAFDLNRQPVAIAKLVNTDRLDETCTKVRVVESTLEVYAPNANPFSDPYLYVIPLSPHDGYRIVFP
jgi:hypothetical protein